MQLAPAEFKILPRHHTDSVLYPHYCGREPISVWPNSCLGASF
jgi:hypothetical protein